MRGITVRSLPPYLLLNRKFYMLLSLITPTHNPRYLGEAYNSLKYQKYKNWEWVIVPNGQAKVTSIPSEITQDKRVRVVAGGESLHNVGALKKFACDNARGEVFVEFDHDDLLMPGDSLSAVADCANEGAGFIYCDDAVFRQSSANRKNWGPRGKFSEFTYSTMHGWESYPVKVFGRHLLASRCFDISPRSLCQIYYCPDHLRAWTRKAYYNAGGHNPQLSVCDDHELMIKTYLTDAKFMHTGGCHYLYRMFASNTVVVRNQLIQKSTAELKEKYISELVSAWLKHNNHDEFDLSSLGPNLDFDDTLEKGFGTNCHGHIIADSELQKMTGAQVRKFMHAAYNALVPGGYLTVVVPDAMSGAGYMDPEWYTHFSRESMLPYIRRSSAKFNGKISCRFQQVDVSEVYPSDYHRDRGLKFLKFTLCALHGQRQPSVQYI